MAGDAPQNLEDEDSWLSAHHPAARPARRGLGERGGLASVRFHQIRERDYPCERLSARFHVERLRLIVDLMGDTCRNERRTTLKDRGIVEVREN
jgi:hypothetical protein